MGPPSRKRSLVLADAVSAAIQSEEFRAAAGPVTGETAQERIDAWSREHRDYTTRVECGACGSVFPRVTDALQHGLARHAAAHVVVVPA